MERRPFIQLEYRKGRFDLGGLRLKDLERLSHLEDAIRLVAHRLFFEGNPNRRRARQGFEKELDLIVREIAPSASTVAGVDRLVRPVKQGRASAGDEYDRAPLRIETAIERVRVHDDDPQFSREAFKQLSQVVGLLESEEELTLTWFPEKGLPIKTLVTAPIARKIEAAAARPPVLEARPFSIAGKPFRLDNEQMVLWIRPHEREAAMEVPITGADMTFCTEGIRVGRQALFHVAGEALHGDQGQLMEINRGVRFRSLGGPLLAARFRDLVEVQDDWLGKGSKAPKKRFLRATQDLLWTLVEEAGVDRPHVFPTPEGGVQAEWKLPSLAVEIEFHPRPEGILLSGVAASRTGEGPEFEETDSVALAARWLRKVATGKGID